MISRIFSSLLLLVVSVAHAAVEDTDVVPASISMTEYCGIVSVEPVDFVDIPVNADSKADATVEFDVTINCPSGGYDWYFDGDATGYSIGSGAKILIRGIGGWVFNYSDHISSGYKVSTSITTSGVHVQSWYATLIDENDHTKTPATTVSWSGSIPLTLEK